MLINFKGFQRPDGSVGTRNHVLILPTIFCANRVANNIAFQVDGTFALPHSYGCGHLASERDHVKKILSGIGKNPNISAVLVVDLGCEQIPAPELAEEIATSKKPVCDLTIQKYGGTLQATQKGIKIGLDLVNKAKKFARQEVSTRELNLGVVCGGSDFSSGLASNPALGKVSDILIREGGTVIL